MSKIVAIAALLILLQAGCSSAPTTPKGELKPGAAETHFKSLTQLTFEGTNAEAYFSPDSRKLIFQGHTKEQGCDQIFTMNIDGSDRQLVSTRGGRNTCSYFIDDKRILFSSTFLAGKECPQETDKSKGYVWDIFKSYDIFSANLDGSDPKPLTTTIGYDAESTVCGGRIAFTSARDGKNLQIYTMDTNGAEVHQLTKEQGYNGGPFYSPDCRKIVFRAMRPKGAKALKAFHKAVADGYVPHGPLELFIMNADGSGKTQLTKYGTASFAPSFFPKGDRVIFSSDRQDEGAPKTKGGEHAHHPFQLWALPADPKRAKTEGAEQITTEGGFNGFPMFSPDGKYLVFASSRNSANPHELNIFLAEWQD